MQTSLNTTKASGAFEAPHQETAENLSSSGVVNSYLPLGINMAGVKCLIVGAGRIATRKTRTLLQTGAEVTVLSPALSQELSDLVRREIIKWIRDEYRPQYLDNYNFVIAATSEPAVNDEISKAAEKLGILYCVVSSAKNSRVIFPAVYRNGQLTVAVHSNGTNCRRSKVIRNRIAEYMMQKEHQALQLVVLGFDRYDFDREDFRLLLDLAQELAKEGFSRGQMVILNTCMRWQCYIQSTAARQLSRQIVERISDKLGKSWAKYRTLIHYRAGHSAYYELLKISLGLDSPLVGETEIVEQLRSAASRWLGSEEGALYETLSSILLNAAKIRNVSGLTSNGGKWSRSIVELLKGKLGCLDGRKLLVVGSGRLSRSVIEEAIGCGGDIINFSRRFNSFENSALRGKVTRYQTNELGRFLNRSDALVLCSELTTQAEDSLKESEYLNKLLVIDMEGYRRLLRRVPEQLYYDTASMPTSRLDSEKLKAVFAANLKAFEQALVWHSLRGGPRVNSAILRIGARSSELSKAQVAEIERFLGALNENIAFEEIYYDTPGDRDKDTPLPQVSADDFFTRDIDDALLAGEIDIAVHSTKDLPQEPRSDLRIAATTPSMAPWDCLVSRNGVGLMELPAGAIVATSSIKRRENLARLRPDLKPADVRGNVLQRIKQLNEGRFDALILASVGLLRLGLADRVTEIFSKSFFPYTSGQGSLSLLTRENDFGLADFLRPLDLGRGNLK